MFSQVVSPPGIFGDRFALGGFRLPETSHFLVEFLSPFPKPVEA